MSYFEAALLGVIQGLTEFLPVSSSGHLVIFQRWLRLPPDAPEILVFDMVTHVGTLGAVALVFRKPVGRMLASSAQTRRMLALAIPATAATAAIGLGLKTEFQALFSRPAIVPVAFAITGVLLWWMDRSPRPRGSLRHFGWFAAVLVGVAQSAAIIPGISRSGATIAAAALLGLRRRWAAEFSFLISAPAILGAAILELFELASQNGDSLRNIAGPLCLGGLVSFSVGCSALALLLRMVRGARLHWFSYYLWALALLVGGVDLFTGS